MPWQEYVVITTTQAIRTYKINAQSPSHARDRFYNGADDDMLDIKESDEDVVNVWPIEEWEAYYGRKAK